MSYMQHVLVHTKFYDILVLPTEYLNPVPVAPTEIPILIFNGCVNFSRLKDPVKYSLLY